MQHITVKVTPRAHKEKIEEGKAGVLLLSVRERAERGEANRRVREIIAAREGLSVKSVRIMQGAHSSKKVVSWK